jgi:hypothetical protein
MPSFQKYSKYSELLRSNLKPIVALTAIGILIALAIGANNYNKIVKENELVQITGILNNQPTIETASEGGPWVPIKLKEFPGFRFNVSGTTYSALKAKKFVRNAHLGDTLTLDILKHDFDTKIRQIESPRFSEKIINYKFIQPFSIMVHGEVYMSLEDVNENWADNHALHRFLTYWLVGISLIVAVVYLILHQTGGIKNLKQWFPDP